jgi:hypothetical protein
MPTFQGFLQIGVTLLVICGVATIATAQTVYRGTDVGGMQPWRAYFAPTDFEHIDTKSGNIVLTFTDLVLPGYNGTTLVSQHTCNSEWIADPLDPLYRWRWHFGFPGIAMKVIERPRPTTGSLPTLEAEIANTPILVMGDGSLRRTCYQNAYIPGTGTAAKASQRHVTAAGFLKYDRQARRLRMPDGTICEYDSQGRLREISEPFGSEVTLTYPTSTEIR